MPIGRGGLQHDANVTQESFYKPQSEGNVCCHAISDLRNIRRLQVKFGYVRSRGVGEGLAQAPKGNRKSTRPL